MHKLLKPISCCEGAKYWERCEPEHLTSLPNVCNDPKCPIESISKYISKSLTQRLKGYLSPLRNQIMSFDPGYGNKFSRYVGEELHKVMEGLKADRFVVDDLWQPELIQVHDEIIIDYKVGPNAKYKADFKTLGQRLRKQTRRDRKRARQRAKAGKFPT